MHDRWLLPPGEKPDLLTWPTRVAKEERPHKDDARKEMEDLCGRLARRQRELWAQRKHRLLVVLQGMDTSGKGGVIRHAFRLVDPAGVHVVGFNRPSVEELTYDYLWRVHRRVPADGEIVIFDRSHYEDLVTVRVNQLRPEAVWKRRYRHINDFEDMLVDEGITLVKVFLHISKDEQRERLTSRLEKAHKAWKFDPSDLRAREQWEDHLEAYADALQRCSSKRRPWYILPSDQRWLRNLLFTRIMVETVDRMDPQFPPLSFNRDDIVIPD